MNCMRCGTKILPNAVFCDECLADMEKHPVDPDTPVNLPRREKQQVTKRAKKRFQKPEDQIHAFRKLIAWLMTLIIILAIALTISVYLLVAHPNQSDNSRLPGQNYGTSVDGV